MEKIILYGNSYLFLIKEEDGSQRLPLRHEIPGELITDESGIFRFKEYTAVPVQVPFTSADPNLQEIGVREAWTVLPDADYRAVAKGAELLNWSASTRYCSVCGSPMRRATEISKVCTNPDCSREVFPSLWPAIVVLVIKESLDGDPAKEEALLVHARNLRRPKVQTLVAGFVETGESLEECVAREVKEETSLDITDIRYVGSQSWPFPHQLMLGFTARYKCGEIRFADGELTFGGFFRRGSLPELPTMPSLSRKIIDAWKNNL